MPALRIIPCLDVRDGRVVKGVQFLNHRDIGDVVEHALRYRDERADELVFYDITASCEQRSLDLDWVQRIAQVIDIPFTVAGGIRTRDQAAACLEAGTDKVSINSPALERPQLIDELAKDFGSQCVVLGVDSFEADGDYWVKQYTGSQETMRRTDKRTLDWVREAWRRGAGEIVLNCMNQDGMREGYDIAHTAAVVDAVSVPVIASGGAGKAEDFLELFEAARPSGALAASVFHDSQVAIPELKLFLAASGLEMRL
ncbi:MAG TPA: imidazole glycerol phosphate synthase subunit HisF [Sphingomicrobium sp.]|nr:imidazole glycerol phosphate synthase subunit HisF [Sphingomicrobium sp.]